MIQGIRVIDFHCHFPNSGEWFPDYKLPVVLSKASKTNQTQAELWRKAYNFPEQRVEIRDDREAADKWYEDITKKNIEKVVFVSGGGNQRLAKAASYHPDRFIAFAHHHPFSEKSAAVLEHDIKNLGLKGYKILGSALNQPLNDNSLYDLWEVCNSYKIPVIIHFGILGSAGGISKGININPLVLQDVALDFPDLCFVVPHFSAGYPTELLQLCWACPNVYVDTSGSNQWVRWVAYELTLQDLFRKFYTTIGPDRILFATDSSWFPRTFAYTYLEEQHRIMRFLNFSEEDIAKILFRNAARLLALDKD